MTIPLIVLVGVAGIVGLGRGIVQLLRPNGEPSEQVSSSAEVWGLSLAAGIAAVGWISFFWTLAGGLLTSTFSGSLTALGLITGVCAFYVSRRRVSRLSTESASSTIARTCRAIIIMLIIAAIVQSWLTPQRFWDERAIFAIKAKVLWYEKSIHAPILHEPDFVQYHPKYPLLLPLAEQHFYAMIGGADDRWPKVLFPLMYAGLVLAFAGVVARRTSAAWGWFCGLLLATTPVLMPYEYGFLSAQADAPIACYHGLAVLFLWNALQEIDTSRRRRSIIFATGFASTAAFIKDEGLAFLLIDFLACGLALLCGVREDNQRRLRAFEWITLIGIAAVLLTPWLIHRRGLPSTTEMNYFGRMSISLAIDRLSTLGWSIPHLLDKMFREWHTWGLHWWLAAAAVVMHPRRAMRTPQQFLIWNLFGTLAALLVAGMFALAELEEHLGGSTHRYLMQLVPVLLLLTAGQWKPKKETISAGRSIC